MLSWLVLLMCLWAVHCKRLDSSMIDPLMRRSPLDKNFMRFGRSSPPLQPEELDKVPDYGLLRPVRAKDNFIRFGRVKQDNFMRFGKPVEGNVGFGSGGDSYTRYVRGKQDNFMRFGRSKQDNFMRFGRGKQDNFMRFGRLKQDNFMRFGRGKQDNFMRFGRGKQGNFMRFGRGKQDNFMRFGKSKEDNFMRFGRGFGDPTNPLSEETDKSNILEDELVRDSRGKQDNFMRFGKSFFDNSDNDIPIAMRSVNPKFNSNFIRFGRGKQDNFMRFGKSDGDKNSISELEDPKEKTDYPGSSAEEFTRESKSKDSNLLRFGRHPPSKDDSFMRFGRSQDSHFPDNSPDELIPPRLKRSLSYTPQDDNDVLFPIITLPDELEEDYSSSDQPDDYASRRKRSIGYQPSTSSPFLEEDADLDFVTAKLRLHSPDQNGYPASSLLAAGLPNVIVGPEFSLLPDLDSPSPHHPGDQSFLRFG